MTTPREHHHAWAEDGTCYAPAVDGSDFCPERREANEKDETAA